MNSLLWQKRSVELSSDVTGMFGCKTETEEMGVWNPNAFVPHRGNQTTDDGASDG